VNIVNSTVTAPLKNTRLRTTENIAFSSVLSTDALRMSSAVRPNFVRSPVAVTSARAGPDALQHR
jgi:hypothetical protein